MKKILSIAFILISLNVFAQGKFDTDGDLAPTGAYGIVKARNLKGGYYGSVYDTVARNLIPITYRDSNMLVFTRLDNTFWMLQGGLTNNYWVAFVTSSGGLSGGNLGSGHRIYSPPSQGVYTIRTKTGTGATIDSTTNFNSLTIGNDTTVVSTVDYALYLHNIALAAISQYIRDSLNALTRLRAGTSAGVKFQSNSGATVAEYGAGGGTNFDFHGFAGYNANRSASYTTRSFTDKNYVDSADALRVKYSDTANAAGAYTSKYSRDKLKDSLQANINTKLNASDSSLYALRTPDANVQTSSYTLVLSDAAKFVEINNASANTLTIPPNASVAFPIGTVIYFVQRGSGTTTVVAGSGVTINSFNGWLRIGGQYGYAGARKIATNTWDLFGNIMP